MNSRSVWYLPMMIWQDMNFGAAISSIGSKIWKDPPMLTAISGARTPEKYPVTPSQTLPLQITLSSTNRSLLRDHKSTTSAFIQPPRQSRVRSVPSFYTSSLGYNTVVQFTNLPLLPPNVSATSRILILKKIHKLCLSFFSNSYFILFYNNLQRHFKYKASGFFHVSFLLPSST